MMDFAAYLAPTPKEQALRQHAVDQIAAVVRAQWPRGRVEAFGSFATGLYLPTRCAVVHPWSDAASDRSPLSAATSTW
jgi:hypothetical protein